MAGNEILAHHLRRCTILVFDQTVISIHFEVTKLVAKKLGREPAEDVEKRESWGGESVAGKTKCNAENFTPSVFFRSTQLLRIV